MPQSSVLKSSEVPLYAQVEDLIKGWIEKGTLLPGSKIPSVREMSKKLRVSISTITQAYSALESHGFVEAKPQSGFYVRLKEAVTTDSDHAVIKSKALPSPRYVQKSSRNLEIVEACAHPGLVPLGGALIDTSLLPIASLQKSLLKIVRRHPKRISHYETLTGNLELRNEIAKRAIGSGFNVEAEGVIVTNGCTEALNLALRTCTSPGDVVAVESPTYHGILRLINDHGLKILEIPSTHQGMDLSALEEKAQRFPIKAGVFTPNFLNPTGSLMPDENKERLVQLGYKYGITVIEDDIYADLHFTSKRPIALKAFDRKDRNYLCSSFSKTLAAGYRIGWMIPPAQERERVLLLKSTSSLATNTALQMALADHLANHNYDKHLRRMRLALSRNIYLVAEAIRKHFPAGTRVAIPQGGCVLWVEFPSSVNTLRIYERALKKNISVVPGCAFSSGDKYMNCLRINAGVPWSPAIESALIEVAEIART